MVSETNDGVIMKKLGILLVATSAICGISSAHAAIEKNSSELYKLRGDAPTGTLIPTIDATSPLPFNKNYVALSEKQQDIVKAKYENLGENDTPPFPARGLKTIYEPVIGANKSLGKTGKLKLIAIINKDGYVDTISVEETPSVALSKRAIRALRDTKFDAASCDGTPCEMTFPMEIEFQ